jgi:hypothetical protein
MDRDQDLSTQDLAQSGGVRQEERPAPEDHGPGEETRARASEGQDAPPVESAYADGPEGRMGAESDRSDTGGMDPGGMDPGAGVDSGAAEGTGAADGKADVALLDPADEERFRRMWGDVQARFVDDPQEAVRSADGLVAELMQSMAQGFSEHKGRLESQWQGGGNADTEDLRQALQRYRSFFDRLLST